MKRSPLLCSASRVVRPGAGAAFPGAVRQTTSPTEIGISFPDRVVPIVSGVAWFGAGGAEQDSQW